jgi:hypothetical protein
MKKIWLDPSGHPALKTAALRLSEFYGAAISSSEDQADLWKQITKFAIAF